MTHSLSYETPAPNVTRRRWRRWTVKLWPLWWLLAGILTLGVCGLTVGFLTQTVVFGVLASAVCVILLVVSGNSAQRVRRRQFRRLLAYIEQAVRLRLPIPPMLEAAAASEPRRIAKRLYRLRDLLESGRPLSESLQMATNASPRAIALIAAAEHHGDLSIVLHRLLDESHADDRRGLWQDFGLFRSYLLLMSLVFGFQIGIIYWFIVPKYSLIFYDFHIPAPWPARVINWSTLEYWPWLMLASVLFLAILVARSLRRLFSPASARESSSRWMDSVTWRSPVIGKIQRYRDRSDAFTTIAAALSNGEPVEQAVVEATHLQLNSVFRRQLQRCAEALLAGETIGASMEKSGMPRLVCGLCRSASRANNLRETMEFLARHYRWHFSRSIELLHALAAPITALVGGTMVLFAWLWLYSPMIALVDALQTRRSIW